jgi:hypothetical protein
MLAMFELKIHFRPRRAVSTKLVRDRDARRRDRRSYAENRVMTG